MESGQSLEEESLLLVVGEGKSLDSLGGSSGSFLDSLGGGRETSGTVGALGNSSGLVV